VAVAVATFMLVIFFFLRATMLTYSLNRKIGRSREEARREREAEEQENGLGSNAYPDEDDDDMQL
jgi:CHASE3 domain sensor protein